MKIPPPVLTVRAIHKPLTLVRIVEDETGEGQDKEDDEGVADEREIWQVTDVTEEELGTTEGEEVDLLTTLLELEGLEVEDKEKKKDLDWWFVDKLSWTWPSLFFINGCWTFSHNDTCINKVGESRSLGWRQPFPPL